MALILMNSRMNKIAKHCIWKILLLSYANYILFFVTMENFTFHIWHCLLIVSYSWEIIHQTRVSMYFHSHHIWYWKLTSVVSLQKIVCSTAMRDLAILLRVSRHYFQGPNCRDTITVSFQHCVWCKWRRYIQSS